MKRDMDLIREIMLHVEEHFGPSAHEEVVLPGRDQPIVTYHVERLLEENFLNARDSSSLDGPCYYVSGLTWSGHEFLDAARNETVWQKMKQRIGGATASVPIEVVKALLIDGVKDHLGLGHH